MVRALWSKAKAKARGKSFSSSVPLERFGFSSILAAHFANRRRPRRKACPMGMAEEIDVAVV